MLQSVSLLWDGLSRTDIVLAVMSCGGIIAVTAVYAAFVA
jgi:hypothetical protein